MTRTLMFIFFFGVIGLPATAVGMVWRVLRLGWENGAACADELFKEGMRSDG